MIVDEGYRHPLGGRAPPVGTRGGFLQDLVGAARLEVFLL
jgi:hypothetical protein